MKDYKYYYFNTFKQSLETVRLQIYNQLKAQNIILHPKIHYYRNQSMELKYLCP